MRPKPGTESVITRYRDRAQNLRTQFARIIKRAGWKPWPKLFYSLRVSWQTEFAAKYCLEHPQWRLSLQTHKPIGLP